MLLESAQTTEQGPLLRIAQRVRLRHFGPVQVGQNALKGLFARAGHLDQGAAAIGRVGVATQETGSFFP